MNFTLVDLLSTLIAIAVFPLFLFVPGFFLGWILNLALFRERTPLLRVLLSLPLSLALTPVIVYLLGRYFSTTAVWVFWGAMWVGFVAIFLLPGISRGSRSPLAGPFPPGIARPVTWISLVWIAVVLFSLVDLQSGHKLYFSAVSYDYNIRSSAIGQLAKAHWYPPANPFFFPGHPVIFRYHYFWFLLCSWVVRVAPGLIGPRHALFAGGVWIGFALMATVALALRFFQSDGHQCIRRRTLLALGLLCITGLDVVPTVFLAVCRIRFHYSYIFPSIDWWNNDQVTGWLDSALWVPHHLAACLCCVMGFLILWVEWRESRQPHRWQVIVGCGVAFASAGGLSVYVAFAFVAFLGAYSMAMLLRRRYSEFVTLVLVGAVALALGAPFIRELSAAGAAGTAAGQSSSFIRFGIRTFQPGHLAMNMLGHGTPFWTSLADFFLLPLNFLFELGALFLIGAIQIRQWMRSERAFTAADLAAVLMVSTALLISIFLRSNTIQANDLGMRGMLIVQFVLVIWGADVLMDWRWGSGVSQDGGVRVAQKFLAAALVLGAASNAYELLMLRSFTMLTEAGMDPGKNWINSGDNFAARAYCARQLYEWLDRNSRASSVEQENPFDLNDPVTGLYSNRQLGMLDTYAPAAFAGDPREGQQMQAALRTVFWPNYPAADVDQVCARYKINYFIVRQGDPVWKDRESWIWKRKSVYANALARAFACGIE